ncbi:MAG: hypothetical protein RLZZ296_1330 [Pseudomonadota bacterium]
MKNLYFLVTAGCMVFSQAHADTAYRNAQTKSQAEGQYLSAFWKEAQTSHAFVDAFSDPLTELVIGESESVHMVDGVANASRNMNQTLAVVQLQK